MSAGVSRYVGTQTFAGSLDVQRQILQDYHEDVQKYAEEQRGSDPIALVGFSIEWVWEHDMPFMVFRKVSKFYNEC